MVGMGVGGGQENGKKSDSLLCRLNPPASGELDRKLTAGARVVRIESEKINRPFRPNNFFLFGFFFLFAPPALQRFSTAINLST